MRTTAQARVAADPVAADAVGDRYAAEHRPPGADRYVTWWKVWLPIPLLLLLLDVTFNAWFWHIPKLTGTSADYTYQYLRDLAHLRGTHDPARTRVVAFGSSVSSAFDQFQIADLLHARHPELPIEITRLTKPGSKPSDHRLVWQVERDAVDPDVAVIVFNLVDFLNPSFERDLKPEIRLILPPWQTLIERWKYLPTVSEKLDVAVAGVSNLYRYRKSLQSAIEDHAKAAYRWLRGGAPGGYGWFADGFTADRFGIPLSEIRNGQFEYYVHPAWIAQRGAVRLEFAIDGEPFATRVETTPGWKALPVPNGRTGLLQGSADSVWTPRAAGLGDDVRLLGVQLRAVPPASLNHGRPPFRYYARRPSDVDEFLRMGTARGDEYAVRWQAALTDGSEFARRFRAYRDVKLALRGRAFTPTGEFAELRGMVDDLTAAGVRVVLVNTPESPLLDGLVTSDWYRDYLGFFRGLERANPHVRFIDLHDALPAEDLNDWHHVNYIGQIKLGPVFAEVLAEEIAEQRAEKGGDRAL